MNHRSGRLLVVLLSALMAMLVTTAGAAGAVVRKPDGRIARSGGSLAGNNIYNTTAAGQGRVAAATPGHSVTFRISIQNDGKYADRFTVKASGGPIDGYTVKYARQTVDITSDVVAGSYQTSALVSGAKFLISATVTVGSSATVGSSVTRLVTIASVAAATRKDAVKLTVNRAGVVVTDKGIYTEPPAPALPNAGETFVDPAFNTTLMRVTDQADGSSCAQFYSYWPTFNRDSTRFILACDGSPRLYRFDPANFRIVSKGPLFAQPLPGGGYMNVEDALWSGSNANVLYGYRGLKLWAYDVSTLTYSLVKDFTGAIDPGHLGQMSRSIDDNVFAFSKKDPGYSVTGYVVWRRDQNRVLRDVDVANLDEVQIDKSGRFLAVKAALGGGVDVQAVDLSNDSVESLKDAAPDYSPGHSDNGSGIIVGHDNWNNQYTLRRYSTPHAFRTVIGFGSDWSQANHLSMLSDDEGWCLISNFTAGTGPVGAFRQEIFQVSTDGSQRVRRLAHHHSVYRDYWDSPRANISRDGRFVAFTSNWGSSSRRDVFLIKVP